MHKITIYKSQLHSSIPEINSLEFEIKSTILLTFASKKLTEQQNIMKEIKDLYKCRGTPCPWIGRPNLSRCQFSA
jgi:hypothetical protein